MKTTSQRSTRCALPLAALIIVVFLSVDPAYGASATSTSGGAENKLSSPLLRIVQAQRTGLAAAAALAGEQGLPVANGAIRVVVELYTPPDGLYEHRNTQKGAVDLFSTSLARVGALRSKPRAKTHNFAYTGLIRCGECGLMVTAEEHVNRQGHHYTYYRCTKKRPGYRCRQPFVSLSTIEAQILWFLEEISIPEVLHRWALSKLARAESERMTDLAVQRRSLAQAQAAARRELDNLTTLRLRDLLTDAEFVAKREELRRVELRLQQNLAALENGASWLEPTRLLLSLSKDGPILFRGANNTRKRAILEIVGSNLVLTDQRLSIDAKKPFRRWAGKPDRSQMWT